MKPTPRCPHCRCAEFVSPRLVLTVGFRDWNFALIAASSTLIVGGMLEIPWIVSISFAALALIPCFCDLHSKQVCERCDLEFRSPKTNEHKLLK